MSTSTTWRIPTHEMPYSLRCQSELRNEAELKKDITNLIPIASSIDCDLPEYEDCRDFVEIDKVCETKDFINTDASVITDSAEKRLH
eukprot:Awhi_evm1s11250